MGLVLLIAYLGQSLKPMAQNELFPNFDKYGNWFKGLFLSSYRNIVYKNIQCLLALSVNFLPYIPFSWLPNVCPRFDNEQLNNAALSSNIYVHLIVLYRTLKQILFEKVHVKTYVVNSSERKTKTMSTNIYQMVSIYLQSFEEKQSLRKVSKN